MSSLLTELTRKTDATYTVIVLDENAAEPPRHYRLRPRTLIAMGLGGLPFAIAQMAISHHIYGNALSTGYGGIGYLLSLDGFAVHRAGAGLNLSSGRNRASLTFAVENLADRYYREHFQFAPSRGRSFTIGLSVGAF